MLVQHNAYRARNGAPPMTWDPVLANYALANAQQNAATRNLLHTFQQTPGTTPYAGSQTYGENIGFQSGANNPLKIVWLFYNEESQYNRATPGFQTNAGHFTQLVWVGSTRLGCAYVATNDASQTAYYLACEYAPAGNINSPAEFTANVLPNDGSSFPTAPADNI
ncbi:CAP domain-containing protein [Protomyces lactucae-debilis]|uniref:CAP domain-containing protein n=1 Tax=Protomyces lactucae-debilis TaxID=2754530 RepID=A0A1Y2ETR1_PROLT|nr:CAP domain-containing protein [Protomyces lactucae-debilis]ORY74566.1 CAP domain-containing protein [Protomyces lactucae-debilis]